MKKLPMGDLEENIFKQNIPGRWSKFESENSDLRNDEAELSDDAPESDNVKAKSEDERLLNFARSLHNEGLPESISRSILANRLRQPATGVKGVLADYKAASDLELALQSAEEENRADTLRRMVSGHVVKAVVEEEADIDDLDLDDDAFMQEFRMKRLLELQQQRNDKVFGIMLDVSGEEYLSQIEGQDSNTIVILHLYEPSVQDCVLLNRILEKVCSSRPSYLFLRMSASANSISVDRLTLPILAIYKAGELVTSLVAISTEFDGKFTVNDIEWLLDSTLQSHGLLSVCMNRWQRLKRATRMVISTF